MLRRIVPSVCLHATKICVIAENRHRSSSRRQSLPAADTLPDASKKRRQFSACLVEKQFSTVISNRTGMSETCRNDTSPRPSPFGPARILVPENQQVICIPSSTTVSDAVRMMIDTNFSQLSVVDENKQIVGVFSYRSLGERVYGLQDKIALSTLPVSECLEPATFLDADDYIDTSNAVAGKACGCLQSKLAQAQLPGN
jgi:CBS domain